LWLLVEVVVVVTEVDGVVVVVVLVGLKLALGFPYQEVYRSLLVLAVVEVLVQLQQNHVELMDQTQYFLQ
jgi:hypothetical protein